MKQYDKARIVVLTIFILSFGFGLCGTVMMSAMAKEPAGEKRSAYYTSIEIREGDTLWKIAQEYAPGTGLSVSEYVGCLRQMNRLSGDTIHTGNYLTVMYGEPQL